MHEQVERLLSTTSDESLTLIARDVVGDDSATLTGDPSFEEITASHNDGRTIGIVKASGTAVSVRHGSHHNWSSVAKIIDNEAEAGNAAAWVSPENETKIYDLGLFMDDDLPLRPAKCHAAESRDDRFTVLWLEDLTDAVQPPWMPEHFVNAASHLGQFNGFHFRGQTELPLIIDRDGFFRRWSKSERRAEYEHLIEAKNDKHVKAAWAETPIEVGLELAVLFEELLDKAKEMPHGLAFGDSHARNMFPVGKSTVGIDWAGMSYEPLGCDAGVMAGSAFTFGLEEAERAVENEPLIFESYLGGLDSAGWKGDRNEVRIGYLSQFLGYLCAIGTSPVWMFENESRRSHIEHRLGARLEDVPGRMSPGMALFPKYVEELKQLLR